MLGDGGSTMLMRGRAASSARRASSRALFRFLALPTLRACVSFLGGSEVGFTIMDAGARGAGIGVTGLVLIGGLDPEV